jgi:UDP-N-acetylmuramoyl-tripeptide--D-alanyl-D-alanine ligase
MIRLSELLNNGSVTGYKNIDPDAFVAGGKTDSRQITPGDIYFALKGNNSDGHEYVPQSSAKGACASVVDESYDNQSNHPVIFSKDVEKTLGEFARSWRKGHSAKIVGITGTNGKTTTKEILGRLLSVKYKIISTFKNYNNQIGVPLTLLSIKDSTEIAIVEIGTNHFGEIEYLSSLSDPDYGLITNIGEGHLEFLIDKEGVYREKSNLFMSVLKKRGKIFVNKDDDFTKNWKGGDIVTFGSGSENDYHFENLHTGADGYPVFTFKGEVIKMAVPGILNVKNALAAVSIASELGMTPSEIASVLKIYRPTDKRYELISYKNSQILLDCYNANPTSVENFAEDIAMYKNDAVLVLGDMLELGADSHKLHIRILDFVSKKNFAQILVTGSEMGRAFSAGEFSGKVKNYPDFNTLKAEFDKLAEKGAYIAVKGSRGMKLEKLTEQTL